MTDMEQRVWRAADEQRARYIGFLQQLVQAAQHGEDRVQQRVADEFAAIGCAVESMRYDPHQLTIPHETVDPQIIRPGERENVVGQLGTGDGRSVLFWAHPDSAPVENTAAWQHDPFVGEIDGGRLYGWGASDDLQGVAIMTCALHAVVAAGATPQGNVILASTPSKQYVQGIIAVMDAGYVADASVYLHPAESGHGLQDIKAITCGSLSFRIRVPGAPPDTPEPGHVVFSHQAINPIDKAWIVYDALRRLDAERGERVHFAPLTDAIGRSTNLHIATMQTSTHTHLAKVADSCELAGTIIFPPGETAQEVQAEITDAIARAAQQDAWLHDHPPQIEWLRIVTSGAEVPVEHPLFQTVSQAIIAVTGIEPQSYPLHTGSDIRNPMLYKNIPCVGFGPLSGDSTQIGHHDEWVDVEDYLRAVKVAASIIVNWCGVQ